MSAPYRSQRLAISLMKLILVARKLLDEYLTISLDEMSMMKIGCPLRVNGSYASRNRAAATLSGLSGSSTPQTTRSGFMKSPTASPSLRNSGLLPT